MIPEGLLFGFNALQFRLVARQPVASGNHDQDIDGKQDDRQVVIERFPGHDDTGAVQRVEVIILIIIVVDTD